MLLITDDSEFISLRCEAKFVSATLYLGICELMSRPELTLKLELTLLLFIIASIAIIEPRF